VLDETIEERLIERANEVGTHVRARLNALKADIPVIGDVRGLGMLNAIEIVADQRSKAMLPRSLDVLGRIQSIARERGLLIYGRRTHGGKFGDWIMVTPPLIATTADIDEIAEGLSQTLRVFSAEVSAAR
jgi:4-aminobutyrate aminotransferase-like enzyme